MFVDDPKTSEKRLECPRLKKSEEDERFGDLHMPGGSLGNLLPKNHNLAYRDDILVFRDRDTSSENIENITIVRQERPWYF